MRTHGTSLAIALCLVGGCVSTGKYNAKVGELKRLLADHDGKARAAEQDRDRKIKQLEADETALQTKLSDTESRLKEAVAARDSLGRRLDDATLLAGELKTRLAKLGQNVEKLTSEKGQLKQILDDAQARLDELRRQKAAAEERATTFKQLVQRLHSMIDAGQLKVGIRDGRMIIAMPNDVLFDSGRTEIKPVGQRALGEVAQVLSSIHGRDFLVAGHTDDVPIHTERFPSNWELSTARAVVVTKFLIAHSMPPEVLAAAGYGEFDPVAKNDSDEHRALNRRTEIVLQPNLSELPTLNAAQLTSSLP